MPGREVHSSPVSGGRRCKWDRSSWERFRRVALAAGPPGPIHDKERSTKMRKDESPLVARNESNFLITDGLVVSGTGQLI